jgi:hypothetical protein
LTDDEVSEIMEHDEKSLSHYLKGFVQAAIRVDKYEAADSARKVRQNEVFGSTVENPIFCSSTFIYLIQSL